MWQKIKSIFKKQLGGGLLPPENEDPNVFSWNPFSIFGASYTPKSKSVHLLEKVPSKNQKYLGVCVLGSGAYQKDEDEGGDVDIEWAAANLRKKGKMSESGTSLSAWHELLRTEGIKMATRPINYDQSWYEFSDPAKLLGVDSKELELHKDQSYYRTSTLDKVLEEIDNKRLSHTGCIWYDGYNNSGLTNLKMLVPFKGREVGGHAVTICGYDLDYYGYKVLIVRNTFSSSYGLNGDFFVKFEDFSKVFAPYGAYITTDMPKDTLKFLTMFEGKVVRPSNSKSCYLITNSKKRGFPDSAMLMLFGFSWSSINIVEPAMLDLIEDGGLLREDEIPSQKWENMKLIIKTSQNKDEMRKVFEKYFPELF